MDGMIVIDRSGRNTLTVRSALKFPRFNVLITPSITTAKSNRFHASRR
jgi:hypothetical protein